MLDEGELDAEIACYFNCLLTATCEDLAEVSCDPVFAMPDPALVTCVQGCEMSGPDFTCGDGSTILADYECDDEPDCADGSDEASCVALDCADGSGTYPMAYQCDGDPDCTDPADYQCDGEHDCADGSDELGCPSYTCADGEIVVGGARCDFDQDCTDNSDEAGCAQLICPP